MSDTENPVAASIDFGPRLARLVGKNPESDQAQVLLRPALPGVPVVPVVEERFSEPDQLYVPQHTDDMEVTPEEPGLSQRQTMVEEEPAPSKTMADTPPPENDIPDPEPQVKATLPNTEYDSAPSDDSSTDHSAPQSRALRPPPVITRIVAEKAGIQSKFQPEDTPAPTVSRPPQAPREKAEAHPEAAATPARERIVEQVIKPVPSENIARLNETSNAPDKAREEPTDVPASRTEAVEIATRPRQAKDDPHAPDITPTAAPPNPTEHPAQRLVPVQEAERGQPTPPRPLAAKHPEPKLPVRVEIGSLNITLRQPGPPPARPALPVTRKAPRAHSIPLRGFGED